MKLEIILKLCKSVYDWLMVLVCLSMFSKLLIFQSSVFCRYFFIKWNFKSIAIAPALGSLNHDSFAAYDLIGQIIRHYIRVWIYPQKCCLIYGYNYSFKYPLFMLYMCIINLVEEQKRGNVLFLFFYTTRGFQNIINIYTKKWSSYSLYHTWYQKVIYCTLPFLLRRWWELLR